MRPSAKSMRIATALRYIATAAQEGQYPQSGTMAANELLITAGLNPNAYVQGEVSKALERCGLARNIRREFRVRAVIEFAPMLSRQAEYLLGQQQKVKVLAR